MEASHRAATLRISERAMQATQMVGDLLDFTRTRLGGGIPIDRSEVDLGKIVEDVADAILAAHPQSNVQVDVGKRPIGQWDRARISQALTNLLGNAVEHGDSGHAITVSLDSGEEDVVIRVHNRGAIPADQLDGLFSPMKLRALSGKRSGYGPTGNLGLGLYIAERIVNAHGGRIEAESSQTRGTTFTIHLPRSD